MSILAINGGKPVLEPGSYKRQPWPPVDEETAEMLKELYLSGKWSFNSESEQQFEREFAEYHGAKYGIFMSNGTVTLECSLLALGVKPGDEVIVPGFTWMATAMAVVYTGATPVFVDVEKETCCMSPEAFEKAITPKTRAVIPVHLYGSMADLDKIIAIAKAHNIAVLEDCAHMQGGMWNGRGAGSWGNAGSFSFQQSKTITSGEGGICLTNDPEIADRIYRAKHIGYSRMDQQGGAKSGPPAEYICHNYRGLAMCALILSRQLKNLKPRIEQYNRFVDHLRENTADIPGLIIQKPGRLASPQGFYGLQIMFEPEVWKVPATKIIQAVCSEGVSVYNNYGPVYKHMLFNTKKYRNTGCPNAEWHGVYGMTFSHTNMSCADMAPAVAEVLHKLYDHKEELI